MFEYVVSNTFWVLATTQELAQLPIRVFIIPALSNQNLLDPILDAIELNILINIILFSFLASICLVNVLLFHFMKFVNRKLNKTSKDDKAGTVTDKTPRESDTDKTELTTKTKLTLPFSRVRIKSNKEQRK